MQIESSPFNFLHSRGTQWRAPDKAGGYWEFFYTNKFYIRSYHIALVLYCVKWLKACGKASTLTLSLRLLVKLLFPRSEKQIILTCIKNGHICSYYWSACACVCCIYDIIIKYDHLKVMVWWLTGWLNLVHSLVVVATSNEICEMNKFWLTRHAKTSHLSLSPNSNHHCPVDLNHPLMTLTNTVGSARLIHRKAASKLQVVIWCEKMMSMMCNSV